MTSKGSERGGDVAVEDHERGAILILALAFIVVVSVIVVALSTWATNDLNNTTKFSSARALDYAATSVTQVAIENIRFNPIPTATPTKNVATPLSYCWVPASSGKVSELTFNGVTVAVWCSTLENLASAKTRQVSFFTCATSLTPSSSAAEAAAAGTACFANPLLRAVVTFDDYPPGGAAILTSQCTSSCGKGLSLDHWVWASGTTGGAGQSANSIVITSTAPGGATVGGTTYTPTATATSGDAVAIAIATSTPTVCTISLGVVSFVASGTCTVTFNDLGNLTYAPATQQSQNITVGQGANSITITSTSPGSVIVGATYTPSATATSGDTVVITSGTTGVCTISSGNVQFNASGTCTINFNDAGNSNYPAAAQVQQSITVANGSSGSYSGASSGNLTGSNQYYSINSTSGGSGTTTANSITPGIGETLTGLTFTMDTSSGSDHTATVGIITGGTWTATSLTCTVVGGNRLTTCSITRSVTVPVGSSINVQAIGNNNHTGSWTVTYTRP